MLRRRSNVQEFLWFLIEDTQYIPPESFNILAEDGDSIIAEDGDSLISEGE